MQKFAASAHNCTIAVVIIIIILTNSLPSICISDIILLLCFFCKAMEYYYVFLSLTKNITRNYVPQPGNHLLYYLLQVNFSRNLLLYVAESSSIPKLYFIIVCNGILINCVYAVPGLCTCMLIVNTPVTRCPYHSMICVS